MLSHSIESKQRLKNELAKRATALAIKSEWEKAMALNQKIVADFPNDLEAYNRLGKALTELGRAKDAKTAFKRALEISPSNAIAKANLSRLEQLGDDTSQSSTGGVPARRAFIEESGKAAVTMLINPAPPKAYLKMSAGRSVLLDIGGGSVKVADSGGTYLGQIEPRLASRIIRLTKGGNRYEAAVTHVGQQELTVIVREVFKHPSQSNAVSFPQKSDRGYQVYLPNTVLGYEADGDAEDSGVVEIKDWSNDHTEPGGDDAFMPVVHRIVNSPDEGTEDKY